MKQRTLAESCSFSGKGLHTGRVAQMTVRPAPENTGVRFLRTDIGPEAYIDAVAENVTNTARCTLLSSGDASVSTVEHLLSALTGMGIDNAVVEIDNVEVPILDGSASYYVKAFAKAGTVEQDAERQYIAINEEIELKDEKTGSWVKVTPADDLSYGLTVDFNSRVLGVQTAEWDPSRDYAAEIGTCRTFVFFHEIEYLFANNLIKGGDVDNAIVNMPKLKVNESGYLNNLELRFPNECGRHKLLDMIGDFRLAGGYLKAHITGYKPGHGINTNVAKAIRKAIGAAK